MDKCVKTMDGEENEEEMKKNWSDYIMKLCLCPDVQHLCWTDIAKRIVQGVLRKNNEVTELNKYENKVELMIVNVKNHSMRVLKGTDGEELVEMDLSELKENEIIDLNDEGRRWKGGVLKGEMFGYGRLYDEENRLEYEGWMIDGVKRCYGIEYWSDLGIVKYDGCWYHGVKNGYGLLYDRKGDIEYEGLFKDEVPYSSDSDLLEVQEGTKSIYEYNGIFSYFDREDQEEGSQLSDEEDLFIIDSYIKELKIICGDYENIKSIWFEMLPNLIILSIESSFLNLTSLIIDRLPSLESIDIELGQIRRHNPQPNYGLIEGSILSIQHCPKLKKIRISGKRFPNYQQCILQDLPLLQDLVIENDCFSFCTTFELKGRKTKQI